MDFIPLLPAGDAAPGPRKISPTDISQYIRLDQCQRYLRLRLHERAHGRGFLTDYGVAAQSIPPILTRSGAAFESEIERQVRDLVGDEAAAIHCNKVATTDPRFAAAYHNEALLALARDLPPGGLLFLFQTRLQVTVGAWQLRGDVDILRLERDAAGALHVLIADMKSSTSAKVEHRLQVAFYHEMLSQLFADADVAASFATAILYRGPAAGAVPPTPEEQRAQEEQRAAALARFGVADALLELVPDPESYRAEVATLVTGPASTAEQVARADLAELPYHLTYKCDGCLYNEHCMKWSAERDDLSLLPYLADHEKNALRAAGVTTIAEVAALKELRDPPSTELVAPSPDHEARVRRLARIPRIGPRLDELIHRARRYRGWKHGPLRSLSNIPSKGHGTLPACDAALHPNLVRVYLDAQHDYLNDRLYMAGSLVVACEGGAEARRRAIVHLTDGPPKEPEQERALLVGWIHATLQAIGELAAPDAAGQARAPIHLIFYNRFEQRLLLDALARHFGAIAAATPLYDFMTQIAALDSPLVTFLDHEIRELKNYPMVCQSLQAVARHLRFDWDSPHEFRKLFRARLFDDQGRLDEDAEGERAWYTRRARFNSQIPLEYAYAAWGDLEQPAREADDEFKEYRRATPELLKAFHTRRLEALEHIARDFKGNRDAEKSAFDLTMLATFSGKARTLADALDEFLTLEHHADLGGWKQARLAPPERRVLAGTTLILRYHEADQDESLLAQMRENARKRALRERYKAEFLAAHPGRKRATLTAEQKAETAEEAVKEVYWLRIDLEGVDCDLEDALALTTLRPDDRLVFAPRWTYDERLPAAERRPLTPTVKQLLYARRARLLSIDAKAGMAKVELEEARGGEWSHGYVFPTVGAFVQPLEEGARYTVDPEPNDWYGYFCKEVVLGLKAGQPNALYARLADPLSEHVHWPAQAQAGHARFVAGLEALHAAGALHAFDANQHAYIAGHGDAPTLLVQGPPGTGKSYTTAFALLARLQGALSAGQSFRAFLTCKTHAATDVLLKQMVKVLALFRGFAETRPDIFDAYFERALLDVPLYRVRPNDEAPEGVTVLTRDDPEAATIRGETHCFVGVTPGGVYGMLKNDGAIFGHGFCDCLVLDEASQMNLPEAAMAALALRADGHLIVVGDHRQMPPIITHGWGGERRRTFQEYRAYEALFVTLLGRAPAPPMVKFAESFRLHTVMADFLREEIYAHDGIAYHSRQTAVLAALPHPDDFVARVLAPEYPLVVVVHDEAGSQVANAFEEALAKALLDVLADPDHGHGLDYHEGLGVVVPHRAQRAALQRAVPRLAPRDPATGLLLASAIDTVERFQGGERRAILVSATESDPDYLRSAGEFLLDPRRLNVALSRAKEKMILVASRSVFSVFNTDEEIFANTQIWKNLLRRTCTEPLWAGERDGHYVEVWGKGISTTR